ncbi:sigma 54-interacting transcriptional regulator [Paenibacillus albidus]|uniref:sigma-54 interaction domain-containing protein n=1 Tax=Paenibacillus albidus TaxID=2041023 RepID=UPI001BEA3FD7|nr:sigma 54-interacting transcriptional regulator [Paenibacillus albidus]MBT2287745.1 sigma 54-interacting transcriptional regulator [Paenibacillus albidus]
MVRRAIAVIAGAETTSTLLCSQLTSLLGEYMSFHPFSVNGWTGGADVDLVIISSHILFIKHSPFELRKQTDVFIMKRTLSRQGWEQIKDLPAGNRYLVVNDERDSVVETISLLYELGLRHVDLVPCYPGLPEHGSVLQAITPGEAELVPAGVENIINIGPRVIDIGTIVEILTRFNLVNAKTRRILDRYASEIMTSSQGLQFTMQEMFDTKNLFEETLNMVQDGVVTYDELGRVTFINRTAEEILGEAWDGSRLKVDQLFSRHGVELEWQEGEIRDRLVTIRKQTVILSKMAILGRGNAKERVLIINIAQKIEELELKLRKQLREKGHTSRFTFEDIVTEAEPMKSIIEKAKKMAKNDLSVLILGENGTGKELFAHSIHDYSHRSPFAFIAVNCSALPENLLESELFGYEEGAFTGARKGGKPGLFEQAHKGTIFLDEIGDISPHLQARLLRVIQQKEILKVGGTRLLPVDVRVIAATNRDLTELVRSGGFREDLYYRLKVLQIEIIPLRRRKEDIPRLIRYFLERRGISRELPPELCAALAEHDWPGNIRELENTVEYIAIMNGEDFSVADLPFETGRAPAVEVNKVEPPLLPPSPLPVECLDIDIERLLLATLVEAKADGKPTGRRNLTALLRMQGVVMTENQIRKWLDRLRDQGWIEIKPGRSGCLVTGGGYRHLTTSSAGELPWK